MKDRMYKQPSDIPPQRVQSERFTDQQSIEEVARLLKTPVMAQLTRLRGDEYPSPHQHNALI